MGYMEDRAATKSSDFELNLQVARSSLQAVRNEGGYPDLIDKHSKKAITMMNSASRNYQEKRNYIRMKVDAPVNITLIADGTSMAGVCRNLSGGGMLIELDATLAVGTKAEVTIASGHGHSPMLRARAEVSRVISQPDTEKQPCMLGLQIIEVLN